VSLWKIELNSQFLLRSLLSLYCSSIPRAPGLPEPLLDAGHIQDPLSQVEVMRRVNRDDFVMEISELLHRQLVSQTLSDGNFRNRLERLVMVSPRIYFLSQSNFQVTNKR